MPFALSSPAFADHSLIPARHARDGENLSPFLQWEVPDTARAHLIDLGEADLSAMYRPSAQ